MYNFKPQIIFIRILICLQSLHIFFKSILELPCYARILMTPCFPLCLFLAMESLRIRRISSPWLTLGTKEKLQHCGWGRCRLWATLHPYRIRKWIFWVSSLWRDYFLCCLLLLCTWMHKTEAKNPWETAKMSFHCNIWIMEKMTRFIYFYPLLIVHAKCSKLFLDKHRSSVNFFKGMLIVSAFKVDRYSCSALGMKCFVLYCI